MRERERVNTAATLVSHLHYTLVRFLSSEFMMIEKNIKQNDEKSRRKRSDNYLPLAEREEANQRNKTSNHASSTELAAAC